MGVVTVCGKCCSHIYSHVACISTLLTVSYFVYEMVELLSLQQTLLTNYYSYCILFIGLHMSLSHGTTNSCISMQNLYLTISKLHSL